ncbi:MAG: M23 family metallopeptidase [Oscillospiraceae bacterium]|nr:M23 family metallopeptidase [Oscillospiraceae bacterium]
MQFKKKSFFYRSAFHALSQKEKLSQQRLKYTVCIVLSLLAAVLVAGSAYSIHAWTTQVHDAQLKLHQSAFLQTTAGMSPDGQPSLRFSLSDGPVSQKTSAANLLLAASMPPVKQRAAGLYVDDQFIGAVQSDEKLKSMLSNILQNAKDRNNCKDARFLNKIQIINREYRITSIATNDAMMVLLSGDREPVKSYTVARGDTAQSIAQKNGITQQSLAQANPNLSMQSLHPGDEIRLEPARKVLSIQTIRKEKETTNIPFQTESVPDDALSVGQMKTKSKGSVGQKMTTYEVTYVNSEETSRKKLAEKQEKAPVAKVVQTGTKIRAGFATGCFLWPTPTLTEITSGYGPRWGSFHYGLDLSGPDAMGQPICAADGGTVIFSAFDDSGFGNHAIIDHGNGFISIYGHASKLLVKKGEKVAQGQLIALVGSTGFSTGPHCHFEVHRNGEKINPTNLISINLLKTVSYLGRKTSAAQIQQMVDAAQNTQKLSLSAYQKMQQQ